MSVEKAIKQNTFLQIAGGVCLFLLFKDKMKEDKPIEVTIPELILTKPKEDSISENYFSDREYFKNGVVSSFLPNWYNLRTEINKIRKGFGSPVIISKGYTAGIDVFSIAKAVELYPENHQYQKLYDDVITLHNNNVLKVKLIKQQQNKALYVEIQ